MTATGTQSDSFKKNSRQISNMPTFEVVLYNKIVRNLVASGRENTSGWSDSWADLRYLKFKAANEDEAKALALRDYPGKAGFVIVAVERLKFEP